MPYTTHGHWYGDDTPTQPGPLLVARCGGPHLCTVCAIEAHRGKEGTSVTTSAASTVALKITTEALRMILRLPLDYSITDARIDRVTDHGGTPFDLVVLDIDAPDAPTGAVEVAPSYHREPGVADPISLRELHWTHADGTHRVQRDQ